MNFLFLRRWQWGIGSLFPASAQPHQHSASMLSHANDTMWSIAIAHRITVADLIAANRLNHPDRLRIGQTLNLPAGVAPTTMKTPVAAVRSTPPPIQGPPPDAVDWPGYILELINQKRNEHGLSPLAGSPTLAQAAQAHAEDCSNRDWCSHVGSDGARLNERLRRAGFEASWRSENWVYASGPQRAVEWWYNEPPLGPHRLNILSKQAVEVGVGIATGKWGLFYIVADFGR